MNKNDNEYKCEYCGHNFFSKHNKNRHVEEVHLKKSRMYDFNNNKNSIKNENSFKKIKKLNIILSKKNPIILSLDLSVNQIQIWIN